MTNLAQTDFQNDDIRIIPHLEFLTSETHLPVLRRSDHNINVVYSVTQDNDTVYMLRFIHSIPHFTPTENATIKQESNELDLSLHNSIAHAFNAARDEEFHDGFDSRFSESISQFIWDFGVAAVLVIEKILESPSSTDETTEETLRQLGKIEDARTHATRLVLLLRELGSPNPRIRDAASIGIADLDDPSAIPFLRRAIEAEQTGWLRTNLDLTLSQLLEHPQSA